MFILCIELYNFSLWFYTFINFSLWFYTFLLYAYSRLFYSVHAVHDVLRAGLLRINSSGFPLAGNDPISPSFMKDILSHMEFWF